VKRAADAVADEGADHREAVRLHVLLDRVGDVREAPPRPARFATGQRSCGTSRQR